MRMGVACCALGMMMGCAARGAETSARPPEPAASAPAPNSRMATTPTKPADTAYVPPGEVQLRSEEELQQALARDVRDIGAHEELARLYYEYSRERPNYAILARQVIAQANAILARSGAQSADLLTTRGLLELADHHPDEAIVSMEAAVQVDPQHRRSLKVLGETAWLIRDYALARDAFQAVVELRAGARDAGAWLQLGLAERREGRIAEAERAFRRAQELAPADPRPDLGLSEAFLESALEEGFALGDLMCGD